MRKFESQARIVGSGMLFTKDVAVRILKECHASGIGVLGYDGFKVVGTTRQPIQEASIDLSDVKGKTAKLALAIMLMKEPADLYYELVLDCPETKES